MAVTINDNDKGIDSEILPKILKNLQANQIKEQGSVCISQEILLKLTVEL